MKPHDFDGHENAIAPKKPFRSRGKGKAGENEVAKMLEAWWSTMVEPCKFKSTPQSGGFGGAAAADVRGDFKIAGDLMTTAKQWLFTVEVKRREEGVLANLYSYKPCPVWDWWRQCVEASKEEGRVPLLFFRRNRSEWLVMIPRADFGGVVPRLDPWVGGDYPVDVAGVPPILTTWEVLRDLVAIKAIMAACRAYVSRTTSKISSPPVPRRRAKTLWSSDEKAQKRIEERDRRAVKSKSGSLRPTKRNARASGSPMRSSGTGSKGAAPSSAPPAGSRAARPRRKA